MVSSANPHARTTSTPPQSLIINQMTLKPHIATRLLLYVRTAADMSTRHHGLGQCLQTWVHGSGGFAIKCEKDGMDCIATYGSRGGTVYHVRLQDWPALTQV